MRKRLLNLLTLVSMMLIFGPRPVLAQTSDVTATWAFNLGTEGQTATFSDESKFHASYVALGTNFSGYNLKVVQANASGLEQTETGIVNATKISAPKEGQTNIDFMIYLKKGLKFTPTSVGYTSTRFGTNGGKIDTYWLNGDGTTVELAKGQNPNRDNATALRYTPYEYRMTDAAETSGLCGMRLHLYNLDANKTYGFCNIVIKGKVSGDVEEETMYTVTATVSPEGAGTISQSPIPSSILPAGTPVNLTAKANAGYKFMNKWTVDGADVEGATYSIDALAANVNVTAQFEALPVLTFAKPEDVVCVNRAFPADIKTLEVGSKYTLPNNYMYYKEGYTMKGWQIGEETYACGAEYTVTGDATLIPVFIENTTSINKRKGEVTVIYDFDQNTNGGRVVNIEGNADIFVTTATVDGQTIDVALAIDCNDNIGIDGKRGKVNNTSGARAQVNPGAVFTIPAAAGSVITLTSDNIAFSSTTFNGEAGTYAESTATYTAAADGDVRIVASEDNMYYKSISVTYTEKPVIVPTVTINGNEIEFGPDNTEFTDADAYTELPVVKYTIDGGEEQQAELVKGDDGVYTATITVGDATYTVKFTNVNIAPAETDVTATWPFDLGTEGQTATFSDESKFKGSYVSHGTNFSGYNLKTLTDVEGNSFNETGFICASKITAEKEGQTNIDFMISLKKGLKFTPTSISYRATRHGTGGGKINTYWLNSDGTTIELAKDQTPNRDNDATQKYTDYSYAINDASETDGTFGIRLHVHTLDAGKTYGFCNVVITGKVTGDVIEETMYTITTSVSPEGAGTVTQTPAGASLAEGTAVEFTAKANAGYKFLNKWTVNGADVEGETYSIDALAANVGVTAQFEALPVLTFAKPEDVVCINRAFPANINTIEVGGTYTLPNNYMYYKEGYTMTGWQIGEETYACGAEYTVTGDATLTPVFTENTASIADRKSAVTVVYDFDQTTNGGRVVNIEANADVFVTTATVDGQTIDVALAIDCNDNVGIDGKRGKVNNTSGARAQVNPGAVFTIPAVEGSVITLTSDNIAFSSTTFNGEAGTYAESTATYTAAADGDVRIVASEDNMYYKSVSVTYPEKPVVLPTCDTPTSATGDFSFEHHTNAVTFTATEGQTLMVKVDDAEEVEMASPAVVYPATKATAYAKAEGYNNSEPVEVTINNGYDADKKYVAWVYTSTYASIKDEGFADDKILNGLREDYNVVLVDYDGSVTPSEDLNNADIILCSEMMPGKTTMSNGMKAFVGVTPMISFKTFNYSSGRWSWGTPANPGMDVVSVTPSIKYLKVLEGVTYEENGNVAFFDTTSELYAEKNHIQTVDLTSAPEGMVELAAASDAKTAMFCLDKYFSLGLSSDNWQAYNANAVTVVKNAAAMLLAGEALNTVTKEDEGDCIKDITVEDDNAPVYTLSGLRVNTPVKGNIYIKNGKKYIVK